MKHTIEEVELKNGARGLLIDIPAATVMDIKVQFRGGMRYAKSKEIYEIAHIVEHLSFGANASFRDEQAYEAEFTKNGAYTSANVLILNGIASSTSSASLSPVQDLTKTNLRQRRATFAPNLLAI